MPTRVIRLTLKYKMVSSILLVQALKESLEKAH